MGGSRLGSVNTPGLLSLLTTGFVLAVATCFAHPSIGGAATSESTRADHLADGLVAALESGGGVLALFSDADRTDLVLAANASEIVVIEFDRVSGTLETVHGTPCIPVGDAVTRDDLERWIDCPGMVRRTLTEDVLSLSITTADPSDNGWSEVEIRLECAGESVDATTEASRRVDVRMRL